MRKRSPLLLPLCNLLLLFLLQSFANAQTPRMKFVQLPPVTFAGDIFGVASGDFNHDGKVDVIVGLRDSSQVAVYLGNGDGTFLPPIFSSVDPGPSPSEFVVSDFNEDGKLDVAFADGLFGTQGGGVTVLLGNGDGTFKPAIVTPTGISPLGLSVGDIDKDGHFDLYVGGNGSSTILFGVGNGTFRPNPTLLSFNSSNFCPFIADLNKDGNPDLITCGTFTGQFSVALGNGDGTFQVPQHYSTIWSTADYLTLGDFDKDGNIDLIVASFQSSGGTIYKGSATGILTKGNSFFAGNNPFNVISTDIDNDGNLDVISSEHSSHSFQVMYGDGTGNFPHVDHFPYPSGVLIPTDLDGDGLPDLIFSSVPIGNFTVLLQTTKTLTATTLSSSLNPSNLDQPVTFTTAVTSSSGTPTGTVTFKDGVTPLGTANVDGVGTATLTLSSLPAAAHQISAVYNGDSTFARSFSANLIQLVRDTTTVADLAVTIQTSLPNATSAVPITFTVTVANHGPADATLVGVAGSFAGNITSVSISKSQGSCTGTTNFNCSLGSLPSGAAATITGVVVSPVAGTLTATASVIALQSDNNGANDIATLSLPVLNAVPTLTSISPASAATGGSSFLLVVTGTKFVPTTQVLWNGEARSTQFVNTTQLKATINSSDLLSMGTAKVSVSSPAPGGGTTGQMDFVLYRLMNMILKSIVYDSPTKKLFATVGSQTGNFGNSIAKIDPFSGTVESTTFIGSEPNLLAASDDGQFLYASLDGSASIRRFDLNSLSVGPRFSFADNMYITADGIAVLPGSPNSVAVLSSYISSSTYSVYDAGVKRPLSVSDYYATRALAFAGDSSLLFGSQQYAGIRKLTLDAQGLTSAVITNGSSTQDLKWNGSRFFLGNGNVMDPATLDQSLVQQFGGSVALDSNRAYYLSNSYSPNQPSLNAYDAATLQLKGSVPLPWQSGFTRYLTRWGNDGFAYLTEDGHLVLMRSSITGNASQDNLDLAVAIQASPDSLDIGSNATYTATITNAGPAAATNTVVSLAIPTNGIFISAVPSQGSCAGTVTVVCTIGTLAANASATLTVTVQMTYAGPAQSTVFVESPEQDVDRSNNTRSALVSVNSGLPLNPVPTVSGIFTLPNFDPILLEGSGAKLVHIKGDHFLPSSTVQWESQSRTTTYVSPTELTVSLSSSDTAAMGDFELTVNNPVPGGGDSRKFLVHVYRFLDLHVNHVVYDVFRDRFYAAISSSAPNNANTILTIDAATGSLSSPIAVGNNPKELFLTEDGKYLYFASDNNTKVHRMNVNDHTLAPAISVNTIGCNAPVSAARIKAIPGYPESVVVAYVDGCNRFYLAVLDNGVQRSLTTDFANVFTPGGGTFIEFDSTGRNFFSGNAKFQLSTRGVEPGVTVFALTGRASYDAGSLYLDNGSVFSAVTLQPQARLVPQGQFGFLSGGISDSSLGRAFFVSSGSGSWGSLMNIFDLGSYTVADTLPANGSANVIRWGKSGLAQFYENSGNSITFMNSPAIAGKVATNPRPAVSSISPTNGPLNGAQLTLTINGVQFVPSAVVRWNGMDLTTTYVNDKQLTAVVPATNMSASGAVHVTVFNPSPGGAESNISVFNVIPDTIALQSLTPSSIGQGSAAFSLTVSGQNFSQDSAVKWNGNFRHTTFINPSTLKADISAADVANAGSASVTVFDPLGATPSPATFTIAPAAIISFSSTGRFFQAQKIGTTSAPQSFTLTNVGGAPLHIDSMSGGDGFNVTNNCPDPVAAGASCSINVTFSPTSSTSYISALTVVSNATLTGSMTFQGISGRSLPLLNPTSVVFPARAVFTNSDAQFINFSNQGNLPLAVTGISISGDFYISQNSCNITLQPFFGCGISVNFRPTRSGTRTGSLIITSDAAGSPHTLALSGSGNDIFLTLVRPSRPSRSSGLVSAQRAQVAQFEVSGSSADPVHLSCGALPAGFRCQFSSQDFVLNGKVTVSLSIVGSPENRSMRLLPRTAPVPTRAMRMGNVSESHAATSTTLVTATSGSLQRSLTVTTSLQ